ncbi:hypothetical protein [Vulgatibacter incomptus]|uniref:Uncharacterized protein n=1 Tax=Vulgatibacter incomptus TaxID=1391653 RepID=A0A0K1PEB4_9BACT|nr:hypothetical protein [Vulgatibacter incomptus]AKU91837.1 hypothetical protein AKJ08_2224 [Vulgatibacter incomptus]
MATSRSGKSVGATPGRRSTSTAVAAKTSVARPSPAEAATTEASTAKAKATKTAASKSAPQAAVSKATPAKATAATKAGTTQSASKAAAIQPATTHAGTRAGTRSDLELRDSRPSRNETNGKAQSGTSTRAKRPSEPWSPRAIPIHPIDGRPQDPRLAAALAARERRHGRSGRPALKSATQAIAFVRERHLVHSTILSALPNLLDPLVGRICTDEERAQGTYASTLAAWIPEIHSAPDLLEARLCFDQPTLVGSELWPSLAAVAAPLDEAARNGGLLSHEAEEALEILDRRGVMATDRLARLLDLTPESFAKVQGELESRLMALSRGDLDDEDRPITVLEPLSRWAERAVSLKKGDVELHRAWTFLFIAAIRSAVVLWPEEIEALYPWTAREREAAIAEAMGTGSVVIYAEGSTQAYVASPVPR